MFKIMQMVESVSSKHLSFKELVNFVLPDHILSTKECQLFILNNCKIEIFKGSEWPCILICFPVALKSHLTKIKLGQKQIFSFIFPGQKISLRDNRTRAQTVIQVETMKECCLLLCSLASAPLVCFYRLVLPGKGRCQSQQDRLSHINHSTHLVTDKRGLGVCQLRVLQITLDCVNLTAEVNQDY